MKKTFLILIPIIFLFCLNIGIQTTSACGSCERCTSQSCDEWGEDCVEHSNWVCDEEGCTGYGDIATNCHNECVSGMDYVCIGGMDYVCTDWNPGQCYAWNYQGNCSLYGGAYCEEGHYECSEYGWHCGVWGYVCDYDYGCTSYGCVSGHTETWEECTPNDTCVGVWSCDSCSSYCSGSDSSCGCTSCVDCNAQDGCVGNNYHNYSCSGNSCAANIITNAAGCKTCNGAADCTDYSVGECIDASSKIASIGCNADGRCFYTTESALDGGATTLHNGGLYQYNSCDGSYYLLYQSNGQSCETHCEGNELYIPGIWESGVGEGCNWNIESCGSCGCSSSGCVADGSYDCPDFCEDSNLFTNGLACGGKCIYMEPLHCDHGCASPDCALAPGGCAASCTGYTCGNAECSGCPFCSVSCPDVCFGSIFETGGYVSNNENSNMACFYANQEWCGDGCCAGPGDPPPPPSCSWSLRGCGFGGCPAATHKGRICVGVGGCAEDVCSLGSIECVFDASCGGGGPVNNPPTARIDCLDDPSNSPSCNIYTDENITLKGGNSSDSDGFITNYFFNIPSLGRSQNSGNPDFFLGNPAAGVHIATLIVTDNNGASSNLVNKNFTVVQALTADFDWDPEFPLRDEAVDFTDLSAGDIVSRLWTFEDGDIPIGEETKQHPQNIKFNSQGSKEVTLTIIDSLSNSATETKYIGVKIPMPDWRETHPKQEKEKKYKPKTENIFNDPFLIFASLIEYFEG